MQTITMSEWRYRAEAAAEETRARWPGLTIEMPEGATRVVIWGRRVGRASVEARPFADGSTRFEMSNNGRMMSSPDDVDAYGREMVAVADCAAFLLDRFADVRVEV